MATEKSKEAEAKVEKNFVSYCIPATFVDQKYTEAMNAKYPDKPRVVIHTRKPDRSINWEESLMFSAEKKNGKPRLSPMTNEQKEKQGLNVEKEYYIVNFSEDHKDKLFINKRVGTEVKDGKEIGVYEKSTRDLSAEEFAATMKNLEPWHNYKQKENAGQEQAVKKEAEKLRRPQKKLRSRKKPQKPRRRKRRLKKRRRLRPKRKPRRKPCNPLTWLHTPKTNKSSGEQPLLLLFYRCNGSASNSVSFQFRKVS